MSTSLSIRTARAEDAARLAQLSHQLGYPSDEEQLRLRLARILGATLHSAWVVEHTHEDESLVVGWMHAFIDLRLESDARAEIGGLVVDEAWRGRGVGGMLVEKATNWARQRGVDAVRVRSNVKREDAHRFYVERGYEETKRQAVFDKDVKR